VVVGMPSLLAKTFPDETNSARPATRMKWLLRRFKGWDTPDLEHLTDVQPLPQMA
jgi:hypothetical protein